MLHSADSNCKVRIGSLKFIPVRLIEFTRVYEHMRVTILRALTGMLLVTSWNKFLTSP